VVKPVDLWDGHDTPERWRLHLAWPWTGAVERLMRMFLATDRASFIHGAKLAVDGGRTAV
jgi:hypothetical protein